MRWTYTLIALAIFPVLVAIAKHLDGGIIRTHGGDVLVVIWLYAIGRAITLWAPIIVAGLVLTVAFIIEGSQAFALIEKLGLGESRAAQFALGRCFDPFDLFAYLVGAGAAYGFDRLWLTRSFKAVH